MKGYFGILRGTYQEARPETPASPEEARESPAGARRIGRVRAVFDLVFWSFVIALIPLVLGLAWNLFSEIVDRIGQGLSRTIADAERWPALPPVSFNQPSGCISVAGTTSCPGTAASWASNFSRPPRVRPSDPTGLRNDA
jgi:hypothetical protein